MDESGAPIPSDGAPPTAEPADAAPGREPGDRPTARRLDAPPSQRYVQAARGTAEEDAPDGASSGRAVVIGGLVAAFVAAIMVALGVVFTMTAGLLVAAFFLGRLTAIGVRAGGGAAISATVRIVLSIGLSLAAIAIVQVALWAIAGVQGGSLGFAAFLDQTYGPLVLLEASVATLAAWWGAAR
jgi:hypothetical protein